MADARPLSSIVIAGGGTAGWMAAAALATLFPGLPITLVESSDIASVGVGEATIPPIRHFNALVGIDDATLIRECGATYKLGIAFDGWHGGRRYLHPFGRFGEPLGGVDFHQLWRRGIEVGEARPIDAYSLNAAAIERARMGDGLFSAFHFDATLYAQLLRRIAEARGVRRIDAEIAGVERRDDGDVSALRLGDGRRVEGALFLDCTGFRSLVLGEAMGAAFVDWRRWLPCDRALAAASDPIAAPAPLTIAKAHPAGWSWRIPLRHRTGNGVVYASEAMADDAAERLLRSVAGADAEPRRLRFAAGHRAALWIGNVVGIGLAGAFLEPLESTSIHLIQSALSRLATMLPSSLPAPAIARRFNDESIRELEGIRDFLVLHYHATDRAEPFWRARQAAALPDSLAARIACWRETGRVVRDDHELFAEASWIAVLLGQGIVPRGWTLLADRVPRHQLVEHLRRCAQAVDDTVARLLAHQAVIASAMVR